MLNRSISRLPFVTEWGWAGPSDVRCWSGFGCDGGSVVVMMDDGCVESIWRLIDTVGWNPVQFGLWFTRLVCALFPLEPQGFQVCSLALKYIGACIVIIQFYYAESESTEWAIDFNNRS